MDGTWDAEDPPENGLLWWQTAIVTTGVALLVIASSSIFLRWDPTPRRHVAAPRLTPQSAALGAAVAPGTSSDTGDALAGVDAASLAQGLYLLALASAPSTPAESPPPADPPASVPAVAVVASRAASCPSAAIAGLSASLFDAINQQRAAYGVPSLAANGCLAFVAGLHSSDMAQRGYFAHTTPEGASVFSWLDGYGVPYALAGENLARNDYADDATVAVAIQELMASRTHRDNILNPSFTELGVSLAVDGAGMRYFTMVFLAPA